MNDRENKRQILKKWAYAKDYYLKEASNIKNFSKATAKQVGFHSAANVQEENREMDEGVNMVVDAFTPQRMR